MALVPFQGISFSNPGYLCYCNSSINGFLASNKVSESIQQEHCACCSILEAKKSDVSLNQSSLLLKEWVAAKYEQFNSSRQQDPSEFMNCVIKECNVLSSLKKCEIIKSYRCQSCQKHYDESESIERFQNIIHLNITGSSVADIVLNAKTNIELEWKKCPYCKVINNHDSKQNWIILPTVLIITLQRFQHSQFALVEPTTKLKIDGASYHLRAVITHTGRYISRGHIKAHLYQGNGLWTTCDDETVSIPERTKPKNGYVFIYDQNEKDDILTGQNLNSDHEQDLIA